MAMAARGSILRAPFARAHSPSRWRQSTMCSRSGYTPRSPRPTCSSLMTRHTDRVASRGGGGGAVRQGGRGRGELQVVAGKGRRSKRARQQQQAPTKPEEAPVPDIPIDRENPQFVIFVRSKKLPLWYPITVLTGSAQAKLLVKSLESRFGQALVESNLVKQVGKSIYQNKEAVYQSISSQCPQLMEAQELEFGMKLLDKENVRKSLMADKSIKVIPPEEECKLALDKAADTVKRTFGFGGSQ